MSSADFRSFPSDSRVASRRNTHVAHCFAASGACVSVINLISAAIHSSANLPFSSSPQSPPIASFLCTGSNPPSSAASSLTWQDFTIEYRVKTAAEATSSRGDLSDATNASRLDTPSLEFFFVSASQRRLASVVRVQACISLESAKSAAVIEDVAPSPCFNEPRAVGSTNLLQSSRSVLDATPFSSS